MGAKPAGGGRPTEFITAIIRAQRAQQDLWMHRHNPDTRLAQRIIDRDRAIFLGEAHIASVFSAIAFVMAQHDAHMVAFFLASADAHVRAFRAAEQDADLVDVAAVGF